MARSEYHQRSRELIEVGYFLSRFTEPTEGRVPLPPRELGTKAWGAAYDLFYPNLSSGRPFSQFRNTLKNSRDEFDSYFDNGREGWKEADGRPKPLVSKSHEVFEGFQDLDREAIWDCIRKHL